MGTAKKEEKVPIFHFQDTSRRWKPLAIVILLGAKYREQKELNTLVIIQLSLVRKAKKT